MERLPLLETLVLGWFFAAQIQAQSAISAGYQGHSYPSRFDIQPAAGDFSTGSSALAPLRYGDRIFFTATVPDAKGIKNISRIFSVRPGEAAQMLPVNPRENDLHAAHEALSIGADRMYFTLFKQTPDGKQGQSEIWYREKTYDGSWGHMVKLPKHINLPGSVTTQPACGFDLAANKELLFFASDRPGGQGKFDIWYCTVERDGSFGDPVCLPVNTPDDEMTPFFYTHRQILFFSSNKPGGLGGFDIYRSAKKTGNVWEAPGGMEAQLNSEFDELYFSYHQPSQTGYFSSNRPCNNCRNTTVGNGRFSIFTSTMQSGLLVNIFLADNQTPLYGCNVELEDTATGTIEMTLLKMEDNTVNLAFEPDKKYRLIVSREGYFPAFIDLDVGRAEFPEVLSKAVYLKPMKPRMAEVRQ
ncbi:MAG: PD40 domain-containing protein [Bacteroidetes bacterium]|nr:PD40 domain-containing protein [Bacteroidota bacterium]